MFLSGSGDVLVGGVGMNAATADRFGNFLTHPFVAVTSRGNH
jgi:hypothetical protein